MFRRTTSLLSFLVVLTGAVSLLNATETGRPNIILIMADDMGFSDLGCYGGEINTPHLDQLAKAGVRWTRFYNNAKCTTTRASLITGLTPRRSGNLLNPNMVTIAEVLKSAGYRTGLSGKWHLGSQAPHRPLDRGFDHFYGLLDGACNYFDPYYPDPPFKGGRRRVFADEDEIITEFSPGYYTTNAFTDDAVDFVKSSANQSEPFFLHVCYTAPHYPLHAPEEDVARYLGKYQGGWEQLRAERYQRQLDLGLFEEAWELPPPDPEVTPWNAADAHDWQDRRMAVYAAMVEIMDRGIGRIIQALEDEDARENTIIMFLSDNGGCAEIPGGEDPSQKPGVMETYTTVGPSWAYASNTPFRRYKQWVHEGGIATPFIVHWPGHIEGGTFNRNVGHIIDVLPTCLELAGATYPETYNKAEIDPVEGVSLLTAMKSNEIISDLQERTLYWEWNGSRAIRTGEWKLCWDKNIREWELYHITTDRTELHNVASEQPERVKNMSDAWQAWARQTGVTTK